MSDQVYNALSGFSKNVLLVWEEEARRERRRKKVGALPEYVTNALRKSQSHRRFHAASSLPSGGRSQSTALPSLKRGRQDAHRGVVAMHRSAEGIVDARFGDDGVEREVDEESPSNGPRYSSQLVLVSGGAENGKPREEPVTLSTEAILDYSHSFHHLHHEAKKRERIRRLEHLRLAQEAAHNDERRMLEMLQEESIKAALVQRMEGITQAARRLEATLEQLHEQEEMVRRQGLQRVQDKVRPSMLRQCGDTTPIVGECVKLLPLPLVEDVFRSYGLVCPDELLAWSNVVGHVVELTSLKYKSVVASSHRAPGPLRGGRARHQQGDTPSRNSSKSPTPQTTPLDASGRHHHYHHPPVAEDYHVLVRFGSVLRGDSHVFELFASCLELAADPDAIAAPLVVTAKGKLLELTKVDVSVEVAGDVAALVHKSSWVVPNHLSGGRSGAVDIGLICPMVEHVRLMGLSADVGDARLRSVVLDEADGAELLRKCQASRQLRMQQAAGRGDVGSRSMSLERELAQPTDTDIPLQGDDGVVARDHHAQASPLGALGLWNDAFCVDPQPIVASDVQSPVQDDGGRMSLVGNCGDVISPSGAPTSGGSSPLYGSASSHVVKGSVIPLKQLKFGDEVHLTLTFHIQGTQVTRMVPVDEPAATARDGDKPSVRREPVLDFRFPCRYPDACMNHEMQRSFPQVARFAICVLGVNPKRIHICSAPATCIDDAPFLPAAYAKLQGSVVVSQQSCVWYNNDIRVQLSASTSTAPGNAKALHTSQQHGLLGPDATTTYGDMDVVAHHEPHPGHQLDFFVIAASAPPMPMDHQSGDVPTVVRRLVHVMVDMRHDAVQSQLEDVHCAVLELLEHIGVDDMVTFSIMTDDNWSMLMPYDEGEGDPHGSVNATSTGSLGLSARRTPGHTPRVTLNEPGGAGSGSLRSHRSSAFWWRRHMFAVDSDRSFRERWMRYLVNGQHRSNVTPCAAGGSGGGDVAQWIRHHQQLASMVHPDSGRDDVKEAFLMTGTPLTKDAQQHVALHVHSAAHLAWRCHVALFYSAHGVHDPSSGTHLLWQAVAHKSRGSCTVVHPGYLAQQQLMALVSSTTRYVSSDVDVYVPASTDVMVLTPLFNFQASGSTLLMGVASYGGSVVQAATTTARGDESAAASHNQPQTAGSAIESVTLTTKCSPTRKLIKRVAFQKLPAGALSNILAPRALQLEMALVWCGRLASAALEDRQSNSISSRSSGTSPNAMVSSSGGGAGNPMPSGLPPMVDVADIGCMMQRVMSVGPFAQLADRSSPLLSAVTSPTRSRTKGSIAGYAAWTAHSTRLYVYHQQQLGGSSCNLSHHTSPLSLGPVDDRSTALSGCVPQCLAPPSVLGPTLPASFRTWREAQMQQCAADLLEMGIFYPCITSYSDMLAATVEQGSVPNHRPTELLRWMVAQRDLLETAAASFVAEENAVRGELEYDEWHAFLIAARAFHNNGCSVQLSHLNALRGMLSFQEDERLQREEGIAAEASAFARLMDETLDERQTLRRCAKHLKEARQNVVFEEEDVRAALAHNAMRIHKTLRLAIRHSLHPPTADEVTSILATLDVYADQADVTALLCAALVAWTAVPQHAQLFGQHGGVQRIKQTMQQFATHRLIVELSILILYHMSLVHTNQCKLEQSAVVFEVIAAMQCHHSDAEVQHRVAQCLAAIAKLTQAFRMAVLKQPAVLDMIIEHLPRWMHQKSYCHHAFSLIRSLAREPAAHHTVAERGVPHMIVVALIVHKHSLTLDGLLLDVVRDICSNRTVRMLLAIHAIVSRYLVQLLLRFLPAKNSAAPATMEGGTTAVHVSPAAHRDQQHLLHSALKTIMRMCGNVADYPSAHMVAAFAHVLVALEGSPHVEGKSSDLIRLILTRFSLVDAQWLSEASLYDECIRPLFKPWAMISLLDDKTTVPSYGAYPDPLACCYGKTHRAVLHVGHQSMACVVRMFSNDDIDAHIDHGGASTTAEDPATAGGAVPQPPECDASVVKQRRRALCRCAVALQVQDAVENALMCAPHQLRCLGFSSHADVHATLYAMPPRYTMRMILMALHVQRASPADAMLLTAWVHLGIVLMDVVLFYRRVGCVHGNLDLDHIMCEDDITREHRPAFIVGPAVAIPPDIVELVPPEEDQRMFTKDEFCETVSRTVEDDDSDARRTLMEALQYGVDVDGAEDADAALAVTGALKKIPNALSAAVFGLQAGGGGPSASMFGKDPFSLRQYLETFLEERLHRPNQARRRIAFNDDDDDGAWMCEDGNGPTMLSLQEQRILQ